ncbi:MAG: 50S ribosomal protein L31 [Alphaproteobacteria bacterium]|nr:50S ribosomal protein L31 [Alphaproteobacteria bacterium]
MKPGVHPEYHEINVIMTDGSTFKTRSTYGQPGETLRLDIDPKTHPAWTGQQRIMDQGGQVAKFNKRFAGIGAVKAKPMGEAPPPKPKKEAAPAAAPAPKAEAKKKK